jgi:mycothiol synthase
VTTDLIWAPLADDRFADVVDLARRCLAVDGGMPLVADEGFLRRRYPTDGARPGSVTVRQPAGWLAAVGGVRSTPSGVAVIGMVDPGFRGAGLGARLLDELLSAADTMIADNRAAGDRPAGGSVSVETESLTRAVGELFASRGLRQVFAEDVMRYDLGRDDVPAPVWPEGTTLADWSDATSTRFHAVYATAFRDRPGFPGWTAEEWMSWAVDEDFRPGWSVLATVPTLGDAGFVTCADGWIVQVGVLPAARGRGLGAALVREALHRMRADGATAVMLDVNVDNPAGALYRRLGFTALGRRARFER